MLVSNPINAPVDNSRLTEMGLSSIEREQRKHSTVKDTSCVFKIRNCLLLYSLSVHMVLGICILTISILSTNYAFSLLSVFTSASLLVCGVMLPVYSRKSTSKREESEMMKWRKDAITYKVISEGKEITTYDLVVGDVCCLYEGMCVTGTMRILKASADLIVRSALGESPATYGDTISSSSEVLMGACTGLILALPHDDESMPSVIRDSQRIKSLLQYDSSWTLLQPCLLTLLGAGTLASLATSISIVAMICVFFVSMLNPGGAMYMYSIIWSDIASILSSEVGVLSRMSVFTHKLSRINSLVVDVNNLLVNCEYHFSAFDAGGDVKSFLHCAVVTLLGRDHGSSLSKMYDGALRQLIRENYGTAFTGKAMDGEQLYKLRSESKVVKLPSPGSNNIELYRCRGDVTPYTSTDNNVMAAEDFEFMLPHCRFMITNGEKVSLDEVSTNLIRQAITDRRLRGEDVLCLAYADSSDQQTTTTGAGQIYTFAGMLVVKREASEEVVSILHTFCRLGLKVVLVSGDNDEDGAIREVGTRINLLEADEPPVVAPEVLPSLVNECFWLPNDPAVIVQSSPLAIVNVIHSLQLDGYVVAFIGGNIDNVKPLLTADIGITFGGNAALRDAADIILGCEHPPLQGFIKALFGYVWQLTGQPDKPSPAHRSRQRVYRSQYDAVVSPLQTIRTDA